MRAWVIPLIAAMLLAAPSAFRAQPIAPGAQMPDAKRMSGVPLPVSDLPVGTVTVRVVRGSMTNVIPDQLVELAGGPSQRSAKTNESGRAEFTGLAPGTRVKASTTVNGERLESQEFAVAASGGIRIALVATDPAAQKGAEGERGLPQAPAQTGTVVLGERSRFVFEMGDDALNVFALLEIVNAAGVPVRTPQPIVFELPAASRGAGLLEGSARQAAIEDKSVTITGPFAPGATLVQFGYSHPINGASLTVQQRLPIALNQVSVMAQKVGSMALHSPQIAEHRDMPLRGETFIVGKGPALAAGQTLSFTFTGLPHQPLWPRNVALALAVAILAAGAWGSVRLGKPAAADRERRRRLDAKRDRLFAELTSLEEQQRDGTIDPERYASRRRDLVTALERVYANMDDEAAA